MKTEPDDLVNAIQEMSYNYDKNGEREIMHSINNGLTKREFFAALSLQGILSNDEAIKVIVEGKADLLETVALGAVKAADALIEALNK